MSNEQPHINPWAEKLQQASLPEADASWKGMERLLDQHMPVEEKKKKRRFFFLFFPLLLVLAGGALLVGYMYTAPSPQAKQSRPATESKTGPPAVTVTTQEVKPRPATGKPGDVLPVAQKPGNPMADSLLVTQDVKDNTQQGGVHRDGENTLPPDNGTTLPATKAIAKPGLAPQNLGIEKRAASVEKTTATKTNVSIQPIVETAGQGAITKRGQEKASNRKRQAVSSGAAKTTLPESSTTGMPVNAAAAGANDTLATLPANTGAVQSGVERLRSLPPHRRLLDPLQQFIRNDSASLLRSSALPDSVLLAVKKKKDEVVKKGWTFSVGVNHFMRINNQLRAPYKDDATTADSEGLTGKLVDYLPVPQARYHFNNKLLVQGELQFNAPQFTQPIHLEHRNYRDGLFNVSDTAFLKKLTYFNLPLSIHYSPVKRVSIGAGVQFSRLTNAIVRYEKTGKSASPQLPDSTFKTSKQMKVKDDSLFQKLHTTEFRLLGDVSYQAGPFSLGLRYNHALRNLVKVPVSGSTLTQARNSSLQLYLRYRFLDKRKRVQPKSK